jgi:putative two-component system hydrogenase maturation factor HypX/HoxX
MRSLLLTLRRRSNSRPTRRVEPPKSLRVLLLVSSFNGLSQRVWCTLRDQGHQVAVEFARDEESIAEAARRTDPELILCPFLKERVPAEVWQKWPTVIIHPGPVGDRGPSSLDWAITDGEPEWGVTALQAVEEMDAGPVWASRTFPLPADPPTKSSLYNGLVADAALSCVQEILAKVGDAKFRPTPPGKLPKPVASARTRPTMRQADRAFDWAQPAEEIVRKVRAADGSPGVRTEIAGLEVWAFDAHVGPRQDDPPGTVVACRDGSVLVAAGVGSVWLGHLKAVPIDADSARSMKLPATVVLGDRLPGGLTPPTPVAATAEHCGPGRIHYVRRGEIGYVVLDCYNGALSTEGCNQALHALRHAARQDTTAIVLRGGAGPFCNGIHLNRIEAADNPAAEAWANITAINDVCRELINCRHQVTIAAFSGSAGAGGVMLPLGADVVVARDGVVLNPYYEMGLTGSELHTYTLPRRVGAEQAQRLLTEKLPVGVVAAGRLGLVDEVGPREPSAFGAWLHEVALRYRDRSLQARTLQRKAEVLDQDLGARPLDAYEARELGEMAQDFFDDRHGFAAARRAFVYKEAAAGTPAQLAG